MCHLKMIAARRRIMFPHKYGGFEGFSNSEGDEKKLEDNDADYNPKKSKKRKRKNEMNCKSSCIPDILKSGISSDNLPTSDQPSPKHQLREIENPYDEKKKHGANAYVCDECGKILRSKDTLSRHKISHSGAKPFVCCVCNKGFSSAVTLKEHKARHDNKMLYECNVCSKKFRQNSCYCRHMQTHSKVFSHVCHICNRQFALKDYLRSHMKKHMGERKYICTQCKKTFLHRSDLNRHKIIHTGKRPYKCDTCGLTFADNSSCRRHSKEHSNASKLEMHACNECSLKFITSALLQQHITKTHKPLTVPIETKEQIAEILLSVDVHDVKESNFVSSEFTYQNTSEDKLHSAKHETTNEVPILITTSKPIACEVNDYQNYIQSDEYNSNYVELENTLQTTDASTFGENLPLTPVGIVNERVNVNEAQLENSHYAYFTPEVDASEKSQSNYPSELSNLPSTSVLLDYISCLDFNNQSYYTWLSEFVSLCRLIGFPLQMQLFNRLTEVYKSTVDVLANPSGLLCTKSNFKILKDISQDMFQLIEGHLNFIFEHLQE